MKAIAYCDGRGGAGDRGSCAAVLTLEDGTIVERGKKLGEVTTNEAEYEGAYLAVELALENDVDTLLLHSDSQIIVNQITGKYKVSESAQHLVAYRDRVRNLAKKIDFKIVWVRREENRRADALCDKAWRVWARPRPAILVREAKKNPFRAV
jgi:ribonuclease HI